MLLVFVVVVEKIKEERIPPPHTMQLEGLEVLTLIPFGNNEFKNRFGPRQEMRTPALNTTLLHLKNTLPQMN